MQVYATLVEDYMLFMIYSACNKGSSYYPTSVREIGRRVASGYGMIVGNAIKTGIFALQLSEV